LAERPRATPPAPFAMDEGSLFEEGSGEVEGHSWALSRGSSVNRKGHRVSTDAFVSSEGHDPERGV